MDQSFILWSQPKWTEHSATLRVTTSVKDNEKALTLIKLKNAPENIYISFQILIWCRNLVCLWSKYGKYSKWLGIWNNDFPQSTTIKFTSNLVIVIHTYEYVYL